MTVTQYDFCPVLRLQKIVLILARVNGGSNYDSLKVAKCLVIWLVTRMNGQTKFWLSLCTTTRKHNQGNGLGRNSGERRPYWAWLIYITFYSLELFRIYGSLCYSEIPFNSKTIELFLRKHWFCVSLAGVV